MFCTTECWSCEDKNCEHYISKQELFFDNQLLKSVLDEIREYVKEQLKELESKNDKITHCLSYQDLIDEYNNLLQILDKVKGE